MSEIRGSVRGGLPGVFTFAAAGPLPGGLVVDAAVGPGAEAGMVVALDVGRTVCPLGPLSVADGG